MKDSATVMYTLAFLVPGFILIWSFNMFVPVKDRDPKVMGLQFLVVSIAYYALWFVPFLFLQDFIDASMLAYPDVSVPAAVCGWFLVVFLGPLAIGVAVGKSARDGWLRRKIIEHGLWSNTSPDWRRVLDGLDGRAVWLHVTLKDKTSVAGLFGSASFAPAMSADSVLYLQAAYQFRKGKPWMKTAGTAGLMINADEIAHVELWYDVG